MFGSGFSANATIGQAIRLTAINAFGLTPPSSTRPRKHPGDLDHVQLLGREVLPG